MLRSLSITLLMVPFFMIFGCKISGVITDTEGGGIENVTVVLSGKVSMTATTNSQGYYEFKSNSINLGTYVATPSFNDYEFDPISKTINILFSDSNGNNFKTSYLPNDPKHKIMHANINCSDFETSKYFYQMLGFVVRFETDVNIEIEEEAAGLNMPPYSLHAAPMGLKDGFIVDLIQWIDPYDPEAPYELINHLGLTHLSLKTTDLDADMATLAAAGVEFLSTPVTIDRPVAGSQLVCFKDPDGTLIELIELGDAVPGAPNSGGTHITGSLHTKVNCSDLEDSRDFYELLGLHPQEEIEYVGSPDLATAVGLDSYHVREARMMMNKGSSLTLTEWESPYDPSAPYAHLNHIGISRIAIQTTDLEADIERLTAEGIEFYSNPITPEPPLDLVTYVCFEDPDGTVIELVKCNYDFACPF